MSAAANGSRPITARYRRSPAEMVALRAALYAIAEAGKPMTVRQTRPPSPSRRRIGRPTSTTSATTTLAASTSRAMSRRDCASSRPQPRSTSSAWP